jgi:hypothetical protein
VNADKFSIYSRPIIASLLVSSGLLQLAAPVLANGTAAGTQITNTATASYEDPSDPNKPLNTFSNTVKVTVAEVAGVTVVADTFAISKGTVNGVLNAGVGAEAGDKVSFDYIVTNVGNDATQLRIPGTATISGAGSVDKVQYFDGTTWIDIPNAGEFISPSKLPGESLKVRVIASILSGATANTDVTVTLGNTTAPGAQNVTRDATGGDIYTVDNINGVAGEVDGAPENGVREASVSQKVTIGATPEAFATVTKVRGAQNPGANSAILTDDTLTYDLGLKVASQADVPATSSKIAADLAATTINLDGNTTARKVLVSDAVPQYTTAKTLTAPTGWTAVYTLSTAATVNANAATWLSIPGTAGTPVAVPAGATRVGFVANGSIPKGTTVTGMSVTVELTTIPATGGNVANIAQVFGSTDISGVLKPVYDESGDNKPNNYNDNGTPAPVDSLGNPIITSGKVDPLNPGVTDTGNNNTGTGEGGEPNVASIVPPGQAGILNGPSNKPGAVGPTGNNDDFTNVSAPIAATTWSLDPNGNYIANPIDPGATPFSNTFETATTAPTANVNLLPTTPSTPLPIGTKVTISYGSDSKVYAFDGTKFVDVNPATGLATTTPATPLVIANVAPGTKLNYGTEVDLPAGTAQLAGYSVPVTAFAGDSTLDATDPQNTTIDRVYTGYLKLTKEAQITDANGALIEAFTAAPTKRAQPGQMIEYRITYTNISEVAPANSGSVTLNAQNIKITEDGNALPNNWALITTHKVGSATDSNNGAITFDGGASNNSTASVAVYKDVVAGPLAPQQVGTFNFTRIVK